MLKNGYNSYILIIKDLFKMENYGGLKYMQQEQVTLDEVWRLFKESDRKWKEMTEETNKLFKASDKKLSKLEPLFNDHWSKLIESLIEGSLIKDLNERNIPVNHTTTRTRGITDGEECEIDIIAENGEEVVVVEVKTTLRQDDLEDVFYDMENIKKRLPKLKNNKIYGAVAYLKSQAKADILAQKKGLLTIKATGHSAKVTNKENFKPALW